MLLAKSNARYYIEFYMFLVWLLQGLKSMVVAEQIVQANHCTVGRDEVKMTQAVLCGLASLTC